MKIRFLFFPEPRLALGHGILEMLMIELRPAPAIAARPALFFEKNYNLNNKFFNYFSKIQMILSICSFVNFSSTKAGNGCVHGLAAEIGFGSNGNIPVLYENKN